MQTFLAKNAKIFSSFLCVSIVSDKNLKKRLWRLLN